MTDNSTRLGEWVDAVADQFEAAWKSVQPPRVRDFLSDATPEQRDALLTELREIDRAYRAKLGDQSAAHDTVTTADSPSADAAPAFPTIPGYDIEAELGQGGMSVVYLARHRTLKRQVAMKLLRAGADASGRQRQRFRAEAEAAARLQHPNIAQVYEVGEHDGQLYLALEYVPGGSLSRRLAGKPLPARTAAALVETLARAMHHAHGQGIVHRDLKPANILLVGQAFQPDPAGEVRLESLTYEPKIADFGLAKQLDSDTDQTRTGEIIGTPSYMAPEQTYGSPQRQQGQAISPLVDVYALGAILYELLTGRPPFQGETFLDTLADVRTEEPVPPHRLRTGVPHDLETICLKALAKSPTRRYGNAAELADDLRRFLDGRPIVARPVGRAEKVWRWCRRNPRVAGLAAAVLVLMVGVTATSTWAANLARERKEAVVLMAGEHVEAAREREEAALAREEETNQRERERTRETLIQKIQLIRSSTHGDGWREKAWSVVREAAEIRMADKDLRLRNEAAATLAGLDAYTVKRYSSDTPHEHDAAAVAFSADGKLLVGGANDLYGQPKLPARIWDGGERPLADLHVSREKGAGPVAFARDGTPLQLVPRDGPPSVLVWDVARQRPVSTGHFTDLPPEARLVRNDLRMAVTALSADGALVAAAAGPEGRGVVAVWETATGRRLLQKEADAHALALAPDDRVLAVADRQGWVRFLALTPEKPPAPIAASRLPIHCLAFSGDGKRLAVGDAGGGLSIWDVGKRLRMPCHGSLYDVYAAAFSPDGTLLASGGRTITKLWDAATGRLLLDLNSGDFVTGLAFTRDRERLAVSSVTGFGPGRVFVWRLENGRGIRTLLGLSSQVAKVHFSPDGTQLAAVAHNWQVAIWDVKTGRLQHLLDVPPGVVGNFSVAFSRESNRFAFASGQHAKLWDLDKGEVIGTWQLPPSKVNCITFHPDGALLVMREETETQKEPFKHTDFRTHPRVCPIRELVVPNQFRQVEVIREFNEYVYNIVPARQGHTFVVEGYHSGRDKKWRRVYAFQTRTGERQWSLPTEPRRDAPAQPLAVDPTGRFVVVSEESGGSGSLVEVTTGQKQGSERQVCCLGPGGEHLLRYVPIDFSQMHRGYGLFRRKDRTMLLTLGIDSLSYYSDMRPAFDLKGECIAWGNPDGSVSVCGLRETNLALSADRLGW